MDEHEQEETRQTKRRQTRHRYFRREEFKLRKLRKVYEKALSEGERDVAYSRIMLLGPAGAGKTSLKRGLMNLRFDPKTNSTIVANVESVSTIRPEYPIRLTYPMRPVDHQWTTAEWRELTRDDELDELSLLLAKIPSRAEMVPSNVAAVNLFTSAQSIAPPVVTEELIEQHKTMSLDTIIEDAITRAISLISKPYVDRKPQPILHVWDCGGQPEFLEVLPAFLTSRTMFLLLFDASEDFNSRWRSVRYHQGRQISGAKVNITILELLHKWMASIHAHLAKIRKGVLLDYPRIIAVGTRGDKLSSDEKNEIEKNLKHTIKNKAFADIFERVCIVDNTTAGMGEEEDEAYKYLRDEIYNFTSKTLVVKTPIKWVLFRKVLQVLVRDSKKNIMTLHEACAIGASCNIDPEDVPKVLMFYHEIGVILFYPHIQGLSKKVILNPKWFVDCVGKIFPLKENDACRNIGAWELLREKGILVEPLYKAVWKECEGIEPDEMIELLVQFRLAVKVKTQLFYDPRVKQFFLPAALQKFTDNPISDLRKAASLHITFATGYVTPGFFARLVVTVHDSQKCKLYFHERIPIFHNRVTFQFSGAHIILTDLTNAIQVDVLHVDESSSIEKQKICHDVKEVLETSCQHVERCLQPPSHFGIDDGSTLSCIIPREIKFLCCDPKCPPSSHPHYLVPDIDQTCDRSLLCDKNADCHRKPTQNEAYWFPGDIKETQPEIVFSQPDSLSTCRESETTETANGSKCHWNLKWIIILTSVLLTILVAVLIAMYTNTGNIKTKVGEEDGDNYNPQSVDYRKTQSKADDGTGGFIPDFADLLHHLSDITEIQEFCSSLDLGSKCGTIAKQYRYLDEQKSEILRMWMKSKKRTWKDFVRPLAMLEYCVKAEELAYEHSVYFDPSGDSKVLEKCKDINNYKHNPYRF